ncbi:MAG TPA: hypothetical protein VNK52_00215, partial [Hyphomicrobiaceae bacterium]|nr:hypothetical protein [Hyphomicrobiaceae bacterium]
MPQLIFALICVVAVFALALRRAPLKLWALAVAVATFALLTGLSSGSFDPVPFGIAAIVGWLPALVLALLAVP